MAADRGKVLKAVLGAEVVTGMSSKKNVGQCNRARTRTAAGATGGCADRANVRSKRAGFPLLISVCQPKLRAVLHSIGLRLCSNVLLSAIYVWVCISTSSAVHGWRTRSGKPSL